MKVCITLFVFLQLFREPALKTHGENRALHKVQGPKNGSERDQNTFYTLTEMSQWKQLLCIMSVCWWTFLKSLSKTPTTIMFCICLSGSVCIVWSTEKPRGRGARRQPVLGTNLDPSFSLAVLLPSHIYLLPDLADEEHVREEAGKTNNLFVRIFFLQRRTGKTSLKLNTVTATTAHLLLLPLTHQPPTTTFTRHHCSQKAGGPMPGNCRLAPCGCWHWSLQGMWLVWVDISWILPGS